MEEREKTREKVEDFAAFDENGRVRPWASKAIQHLLLSWCPESCPSDAQGKETSTVDGKENSSLECFEVNSSLHQEANKQTTWKKTTKDQGEGQRNSKLAQVRQERKQTDNKKHKVFSLLQQIAREGEDILKDDDFLQLCSKMLNLEEENMEDNKGNQGNQHSGSADDGTATNAKDMSKAMEPYVNSEEPAKGEKSSTLEPLSNNPPVKTISTGTVREKSSLPTFLDICTKNTVHDVPISCMRHNVSFPDIPNFCNKPPVTTALHHSSSITEPCNSETPTQHSTDDSPIFKIEPDILAKRMELCNHSIVGRLTLSKGDDPWPLKKLREKLESLWNLKSGWRLISLGRGYFHILLLDKEEWEKVWARGSLLLKPGILRLQRWSIDFDPTKEKTTFAQVWFRLYHLPWGLWDPNVISGIARKVGTPLRFDRTTVEGDFGHFARILVDVDLSKSFLTNIHVECGKTMLEVKMVPENLPLFCKGCNTIGHIVNDCRAMRKQEVFSKTFSGTKGGEHSLKTAASIGTYNAVHAGSSSLNKDVVHCKGLEKSSSKKQLNPESPKFNTMQVSEGKIIETENSSNDVSKKQLKPECPKYNTMQVSEGKIIEAGNSSNDASNDQILVLHNVGKTVQEQVQEMKDHGSLPTENKFQALEDVNDDEDSAFVIQGSKKKKRPLTATALRKKYWGDIFTNGGERTKDDMLLNTSSKTDDTQRPSARPNSVSSQ